MFYHHYNLIHLCLTDKKCSRRSMSHIPAARLAATDVNPPVSAFSLRITSKRCSSRNLGIVTKLRRSVTSNSIPVSQSQISVRLHSPRSSLLLTVTHVCMSCSYLNALYFLKCTICLHNQNSVWKIVHCQELLRSPDAKRPLYGRDMLTYAVIFGCK